MSMPPLVIKLKQALADRGISTSSTQEDVLIAATNYIKSPAGYNPIKAIKEPEWVVPLPIMIDTPTPMQFDEPEMPIDAHSSGPQFDMPAKPKAKTKKKAAK